MAANQGASTEIVTYTGKQHRKGMLSFLPCRSREPSLVENMQGKRWMQVFDQSLTRFGLCKDLQTICLTKPAQSQSYVGPAMYSSRQPYTRRSTRSLRLQRWPQGCSIPPWMGLAWQAMGRNRSQHGRYEPDQSRWALQLVLSDIVKTLQVYDIALDAALHALQCGPRKLTITGQWRWLLAKFAVTYGIRESYTNLAHLRWVVKCISSSQ